MNGDLREIAPFQIPYFLRALGELGRYDDMVEQFSRLISVLRSKHDSYHYFLSSMMVFAFCGDVKLVRSIFQGPLRKIPEDAQAFWIATAELSVGNFVAANEVFQSLFESPLVTIRAGAKVRHQDRMPVFAHEASESTQSALPELRENLSSLLALSHEVHSGTGRPVMCIAILIVTVLAYGVQMANGATLNVFALHQLGALFPPDVFIRGEYWRLIAPLFLHAGATHLFANMFGLFILGPFVERYLGRLAFVMLYLGSGVLSLGTVVMLSYYEVLTPRVLVGASGAVMGLVGATVAIFIGLWSRFKQAEAFRQARSAALIIFFQLVFDIATPQVSLTAHLSGAFAGLLLGGVFLMFRQQRKIEH
jgi:rhomboid protease GluP